MWRPIRLAILVLTGVFLALQFLPAHLSNPPVNAAHTMEANLQMPAEISAILGRSCHNCHSNETHWLWYSRLRPMSSFMVRDVEKARRTMNFSEWSVQAGRRPEIAASVLAACCADLRIGRMPNLPYLLLHPGARISKREIEQFCEWTKVEGARLRSKKTH